MRLLFSVSTKKNDFAKSALDFSSKKKQFDLFFSFFFQPLHFFLDENFRIVILLKKKGYHFSRKKSSSKKFFFSKQTPFGKTAKNHRRLNSVCLNQAHFKGSFVKKAKIQRKSPSLIFVFEKEVFAV